MNLISLKEAAAFLLENDGYLIYTHASPDGDTLGSATALALALRQIGKSAVAFCVDGVPKKLSFLPTGDVFLASEPSELSGYTPISVDVAGERVLGNSVNKHFALSIDHHKINTVSCDKLLVMPELIACGEIIYLLISAIGAKMTKDIATAIYAAICSDSGGFKYPAVTSETYIIAAACIEAGADFTEINRRLFECKTKAQVALITAAYRNLELLCDGKYAIVAISPLDASACGVKDEDFDCINHIPREIEGVLASAVIRTKGESIKVSLRSNANIDVAEIASGFGGGGHYHAAGFTLSTDFESALNTVRNIFSELK